VIQLGEDPKRVFNVGAIALDGIDQLNLRSKKELEKTLDFVFGDNTILVTFHPVTLENNSANAQFEALLRALDKFPEMRFLFTLPNADANGRAIIHAIHEYVRKNPGRTRAFASLGKINYLSALKCVRAVIGNSSSGLIEVPHFKIPTVNIGDRQKGRLSPASVIDSKNDSKNIIAAINKSLSPAFAAASRKIKNPYEKKGTAGKIFQIIKKNDRQLSLKKPFYDLQP
jgi:GDP/UDP-N,N'-diacetylbacillosamine 2-epimerase (hydrolysing)